MRDNELGAATKSISGLLTSSICKYNSCLNLAFSLTTRDPRNSCRYNRPPITICTKITMYHILEPHLQGSTKRWALGCVKFLAGPAWLLLSKTGPPFSPSLYRGVNKGLFVLLSRTQAGPGRTVKQEQEEISCNHVRSLYNQTRNRYKMWVWDVYSRYLKSKA